MASTAASTARKEVATGRASRSEQREQTRLRILDAVMDIVLEQGMRAVRHRAVAQRAGVALGSTTYYFSSLEELIISAFDHWRSGRQLADNPFYREVVSLLEPFGDEEVSASRREPLANGILSISLSYLVDQLRGGRNDRVIEMAIYHECMLYPSLRKLVLEGWAVQQAFLERVHRQMGSACPAEDAALTSMVFRQWEQRAVMSEPDELDLPAVARTLQRHFGLCFGLELTVPAPQLRKV